MTRYASSLFRKIETRQAKIAIVGIGYVGSALAEGISYAGFQTLGLDIDRKKIAAINNRRHNKFSASDDMSQLSTCDIICVCVPTPINHNKNPTLRR